MFCHKCGAQIADDAIFCHKCGTKVIYADSVPQMSTAYNENLDSGSTQTLVPQETTETFPNSLKMVIYADKVAGKMYSKFTFSVCVDGTPVGDLANGQTATYKITSGQHLIKVGVAVIGIDVPNGETSIELDFHWGANITQEIVCHQTQWVSKPSENEKVSVQTELKKVNKGIKAGLVCIAVGVIGSIIGAILMPSSSGSIISAEEHSHDLMQMNIALPFFIGGLSLCGIGALIVILSSRKRKK